MSLDWSTQKVKYFTENPDSLWVKYNEGTPEEYEDVNAETKSLIFGTMAMGINNINYKNAPEFYARWKVFEKFDDLYLYSTYDGKESIKTYLTPDVLFKHLGLSTNANMETEAEWVRRIEKSFASGYRKIEASAKDIRNCIKDAKEEFESFFSTMKVGN